MNLEYLIRGIKTSEQWQCPVCKTREERVSPLDKERKKHFVCQYCGFKIERSVISILYLVLSENPIASISKREFKEAKEKFIEEFLVKIRSLLSGKTISSLRENNTKGKGYI